MNKKLIVSMTALNILCFPEKGHAMLSEVTKLTVKKSIARKPMLKRNSKMLPSRKFSAKRSPEDQDGNCLVKKILLEERKDYSEVNTARIKREVEEASSKKSFDFGFEKVSATEKTEKIADVFSRIASRYDIMNDVSTLGMHRVWKNYFVNTLPIQKNGRYLDLAAGTGDIANAIHNRLQYYNIDAQITASDISSAMIDQGRKRYPHLSWLCANAEDLPIESNSVDVISIAFGLRNMTHHEKILQESYRVLRPGGNFSCLDFSPDVSPLILPFYDFYAFHVFPKLGEYITGDKAAYQYLSESVKTFLTREELLALMKKVGFQKTTADAYTAGVVAIHAGYKN